MSNLSKATIDHDEIRKWAEDRCVKPFPRSFLRVNMIFRLDGAALSGNSARLD